MIGLNVTLVVGDCLWTFQDEGDMQKWLFLAETFQMAIQQRDA